MPERQVNAAYHSQDSSKTFSAKMPDLPSEPEKQSVQDKTAYLGALRTSLVQMQADVNAFLTKRMDESKASQSAQAIGKAMSQEEREEEMYGEEDPEGES